MHRFSHNRFLLALLLAVSTLTACRSPQVTGEDIIIQVTADGKTQDVALPSGSTVTQALQSANIMIGNLDKSEPPLYTVLKSGDSVILTRVEEKFETEEQVVPFERQVVRNESLPDGETRLVQAGVNGMQEITYRIVMEDGEEISRSIVKSVILQDGAPEIVMIGAQSSFAPLTIPGKIAYLAGGNAWLIDTNTANRTPIVTTGDLDGRIFFLSPNGNYLVFTRKSTKPADQEINTIWSVRTNGGKPVATGIANVVHYAEWIPGTNSIAYSTVEPRSTAPGWQANNDLHRYSITTGAKAKVLDASSGGVYGWWGTVYSFSADGRLAYARPDGIGLVDIDGRYIKPPFIDIVPFNTHSDWAWLPSLTWGADGKTLFYTSHAPPPSLVNEEDSPFFDLNAVSFENDANVHLVKETGMFAYPTASRLQPSSSERQYQIAFLQAIFPEQSETSRYRVVVMDRDGSNQRTIFPANDAPGLQPQTPVWAPDQIDGQNDDFIAVVYQGNLWLVDSGSNQAYQVTGDGLVTRIDWK